MTRKQKIVAAITVVLSLGLLLAPFIPAWLFWHRIRQFEQAVGVSDVCQFRERGDPLQTGTHVGVRYTGNTAFRQFLGDTLSGGFNEVDAVGIEAVSRGRLNALRFISEARILRLVGPMTDDKLEIQLPAFPRMEVVTLQLTGLDDSVFVQLTESGKFTALSLVGEDAVSGQAVQRAARQNPLEYLMLFDVPAVDEQIFNAEDVFEELQTISLEGSQFGDTAAARLAKLDSLVLVQWGNGALTDEGVNQLARNETIRGLWIVDCPITDASIDYLIGMRSSKSWF